MAIRSGSIEFFDQDLYNSEPVVRRIYTSISSNGLPVSLAAIFGTQGSGRTSILNLCYEFGTSKYDSEFSKKSFWIKPFKSWKMSGMGNLANALLWHIYRNLPEDVRRDENILYKISKISISLSALIAPLNMRDPDCNLEIIKKTLSPERKSPISSYFSVFEHVEELSDIFSSLGEQICEQCGFEKIVILIDDIDRCIPDQVISFLFYLRNLISSERFSFIIAVDRKMLSQYLNSVYGGCLTQEQCDKYIMGYFDDWVNIPQPHAINILKAIDFPIDTGLREKFIKNVEKNGLLNSVSGSIAQYALKRFELFLSEDTLRSSAPLQNYMIWLGWFVTGTKNPELIKKLYHYENLEKCFCQIREPLKKQQIKNYTGNKKTTLKICLDNKESQKLLRPEYSNMWDNDFSDSFFTSFLEKTFMVSEKDLAKRFSEVVAYF